MTKFVIKPGVDLENISCGDCLVTSHREIVIHVFNPLKDFPGYEKPMHLITVIESDEDLIEVFREHYKVKYGLFLSERRKIFNSRSDQNNNLKRILNSIKN